MRPVFKTLFGQRLRDLWLLLIGEYLGAIALGLARHYWDQLNWLRVVFSNALPIWIGSCLAIAVAWLLYDTVKLWWQPFWGLLPISSQKLLGGNLTAGYVMWLVILAGQLPLGATVGWLAGWSPDPEFWLFLWGLLVFVALLFGLVNAFVLMLLAIKDRWTFAPVSTVALCLIGVGAWELLGVWPLKQLGTVSAHFAAATFYDRMLPAGSVLALGLWSAISLVIICGMVWLAQYLLTHAVEYA